MASVQMSANDGWNAKESRVCKQAVVISFKGSLLIRVTNGTLGMRQSIPGTSVYVNNLLSASYPEGPVSRGVVILSSRSFSVVAF